MQLTMNSNNYSQKEKAKILATENEERVPGQFNGQLFVKQYSRGKF